MTRYERIREAYEVALLAGDRLALDFLPKVHAAVPDATDDEIEAALELPRGFVRLCRKYFPVRAQRRKGGCDV
jgi:hypothetical protein